MLGFHPICYLERYLGRVTMLRITLRPNRFSAPIFIKTSFLEAELFFLVEIALWTRFSVACPLFSRTLLLRLCSQAGQFHCFLILGPFQLVFGFSWYIGWCLVNEIQIFWGARWFQFEDDLSEIGFSNFLLGRNNCGRARLGYLAGTDVLRVEGTKSGCYLYYSL